MLEVLDRLRRTNRMLCFLQDRFVAVDQMNNTVAGPAKRGSAKRFTGSPDGTVTEVQTFHPGRTGDILIKVNQQRGKNRSARSMQSLFDLRSCNIVMICLFIYRIYIHN